MQIDLSDEIQLKAVRSSGKGGQNVNKVSSKVELYFNIPASRKLNEKQKQILHEKIGHLLNDEGTLRLVSQESRSQLQNRDAVVKKFYQLLRLSLTLRKKRIKTKLPKKAKEKRLIEKKGRSEIKSLRKKPNRDQ